MKSINISGIGVATNAIASVSAFGLPCQTVGCETLARLESPASWAVAAVHQAWHMAQLDAVNSERIGLLYSSVWGSVTATVAYLESLHEAGGRYASPRHFTRSTYAGPASNVGIHFNIHGPCETLSFDQFPISSVLDQARRILASGRCAAVVVCWADDSDPIVANLARLAVEKLHRRKFARYTKEPLGAGAVAMVVTAAHGGPFQLHCTWTDEQQSNPTKISNPFYPTDGALALAAAMARVANKELADVLWTEQESRKNWTTLRIST